MVEVCGEGDVHKAFRDFVGPSDPVSFSDLLTCKHYLSLILTVFTCNTLYAWSNPCIEASKRNAM